MGSEKAVPPDVVDSEDKQPDQPKDQWSKDEIDTALRECTTIIDRYKATATPEPPIRDGACGTPAPVKLSAIGNGSQVTFEPPITVNCRVIAAMADWLKSDLQPLAKKHLGGSIAVVETMSSYSCRTAYGRVASRLSEHSFANAIDIRGFETTNGKKVRLLEDWGVTARDVRKRLMAEHNHRLDEYKKAVEIIAKAKRAAEAAKARKAQPANSSSSALAAERQLTPPLPPSRPRTADASERSKSAKLQLPEPKPPAAPDLKAVTSPPPGTSSARFLRAAHEAGCAHFGTILGPEVNEDHRNHFHVDLAPRKRTNYCR